MIFFFRKFFTFFFIGQKSTFNKHRRVGHIFKKIYSLSSLDNPVVILLNVCLNLVLYGISKEAAYKADQRARERLEELCKEVELL